MTNGTRTVVAIAAELADGRRVVGVLAVLEAPSETVSTSARPSRRTLRGARVLEAELVGRPEAA